jgi:5'-AMP-activated protein kinase regulatory gamma subunit
LEKCIPVSLQPAAALHFIVTLSPEVLNDVKDLIYIHPDASLYDAIKMLIHNKIHR